MYQFQRKAVRCLSNFIQHAHRTIFILSILLLGGMRGSQLYAQDAATENPTQTAEVQRFLQSLPTEWIDSADEFLVPGEILVGIRGEQIDSLSAAGVSQVLQMQLVDAIDFPASDEQPALIVQRWQVPVGSEWTIIATLQQNPAIAFAEPNWVVRAAEMLDPGNAKNLNGTIPPPIVETPYTISDTLYRSEQWYLQRINASRALSLMNDSRYNLAAKRQVVIAVLDSGIDAGSPEFAGRLGNGYDFVASTADPNILSCSLPNGPQPVTTDEYGHGSHVAGLLGAGLNNGAGIASVAGSVVKIEPVKVLNQAGSGSVFDVANAIKYAAQCLKVNIINLSLEVAASVINNNASLNQTFQAAVQYADQRNVLQIAAAGNSSAATQSPYPAAYAEVMGVAALTYENSRATYSTAGDAVDLSAPGGDAGSQSERQIYSTWSRQAQLNCGKNQIYNGFYRTINGGAYCYDAGTSMATPLVASVAALVWSAVPSLTNNEVEAILKNSANPLPFPPNQVGTGIVDAAAALRSLIPPTLQPSPSGYLYELSQGAGPMTVGLRIDNPSLSSVNWSASIAGSAVWLQINGATNNSLPGTARYGESSFLTFVISPTHLSPGFYSDSLTVVGTLGDGSKKTIRVPVSLAIDKQFKNVYLPVVAQNSSLTSNPAPTTLATAFRWESPASDDDRTSYTINQDLGISLPPTFTFPLAGSNYADMRIYADGFVAFPASQAIIADTTRNYCLPNSQTPGQAIYAWWADLNPSAVGSRVSTFMVGNDRFVIEFKDVPTATSPTYMVSFQIVLYRNGNIGLNYLNLPTFIGATGPATIGVEAKDGRFGYLLACNAPFGPPGKRIIGVLPEAQQSFLIKAGDIF